MVASFEDWDFWWGFNKEFYLNLKENLYNTKKGFQSESSEFFFGRRSQKSAKDTSRPSDEYIRSHLIPILLKALKGKHYDLRDSACLAIGMVGGPPEVPVLTGMLKDKVKSVRENAVISLGLIRAKEAVPSLVAILEAGNAGRKLRGREPEYRLRAFAASSLGLIGDNEKDSVKNLLTKLSADTGINRNISVNCAIGLGLLFGNNLYVNDIIAHLKNLITQNARYNELVRAHAVISLGKIHERNGLVADAETLTLLTRTARREHSKNVRRSAIIALGMLLKEPEESPDLIKFLCSEYFRARDNQCRNFAAIALGQIGGETAYKTLREGVVRAKGQRRAYASLGLAILCDNVRGEKAWKERRLAGLDSLREAFGKTKNPQIQGGIAIALGIAHDNNAGGMLLNAMNRSRDIQLRGYLALALGMIKYTDSVQHLSRVLKDSTNIPLLKLQVSIGLGLMGTREIIAPLIKSLKTASSSFVLCSITQALGYIGDRTAIGPLVDIMKNPKNQNLTRGYAAIASGNICEDEAFPVITAIATNHNYLASTEALNQLLYTL